MSTYINPNKPITLNYEDCPVLLREFLNYMLAIKNLSKRSVNALYIDLRVFLRFLKRKRGLAGENDDLDSITIADLPAEVICSVTRADIHEFLYYLADVRGNEAVTRSHKLASIKDLYKYLLAQGTIAADPAALVEGPSLRGYDRKLPIYLQPEQCEKLLGSIAGEFPERDYCIIMLFLNCGLRLSELTGINLDAIMLEPPARIKIHGKGNKERIAYLSESCVAALKRYMEFRLSSEKLIDKEALFISKRTGKRMTNRGIEKMLETQLKRAGLSNIGCSPHKLRHTAASLLYQTGAADLRTLQLVLGHESSSTTEIYTHASDDQIAEAMQKVNFD